MAKIQIPADLMMEVARRLRVGKDQLEYILEQNLSRTTALLNEFEGDTARRFRSLHEENAKLLSMVPVNLQKAADELETIVNKFVDADSGIVQIPDLIGEKSIYDYAGEFFDPNVGTLGAANNGFAQLNELPDNKYVSTERPPREELEKGFGDHVSDFFEGAWKPLSTLGDDIVKLGEQMEEDPVGTLGGIARDAIAAPVEGAVSGATFGWNYLWGTGGAREQVKEYVETEKQKFEEQGAPFYAGTAASTLAVQFLGRRTGIKGKLGDGGKYTLKEADQDRLNGKVSEGTGGHNLLTSIGKVDGSPSTVKYLEDSIRNESSEHGVFFDKDGNVISGLVSDGEQAKIDISSYKKIAKDATFTHNHPNSSRFSIADLETAVHFNMSEIRAVTPNGVTFSLKRGTGGWDINPLDVEKIFKQTQRELSSDPMVQALYKEGNTEAVWDMLYSKIAGKIGGEFNVYK